MLTAMAMVWFMLRIDPKDAALLYPGPGSFADVDKPFPPEMRPSENGFGDLWPPAHEARPVADGAVPALSPPRRAGRCPRPPPCGRRRRRGGRGAA
jgi:hypothetical protein